ncbi:MAG: hypothetical protein D6675_15795 [Gemmatimonadetes bacterium]|nr:MAG: hypothetical protein D6675_15795 [Gemmatimonadota bacterium]
MRYWIIMTTLLIGFILSAVLFAADQRYTPTSVEDCIQFIQTHYHYSFGDRRVYRQTEDLLALPPAYIAQLPLESLIILANMPEHQAQLIASPNCPEDIRTMIAQHHLTPDSVLVVLASDPSKRVRESLARNRLLMPAVLEVLASDDSLDVRVAVAKHLNTPLSVLAWLAMDETTIVDRKDYRFGRSLLHQPVKEAVAANPFTPATVLRQLFNDPNPAVREIALNTLLENYTQTLVDYQRMVAEESDTIRSLVAIHERTPPEILEILARDESIQVRRNLAKNPNLPASVFNILLEDEDPFIRDLVTHYRLERSLVDELVEQSLPLPAPQLERAARHEINRRDILNDPKYDGYYRLHLVALEDVTEFQRSVVWDLKTPAELLTSFATHEDWQLRYAVAMHPNTPVEVVKSLTQDTDPRIRRVARIHPAAEIPLETLATDTDVLVRLAAARHPAISALQLNRMMPDSADIVRIAIAQHPTTATRTLRELATDKQMMVRIAVAENPNTFPVVLTQLSKDPRLEVGLAVCVHPQTPLETLKKMSSLNTTYQTLIAKTHTEPELINYLLNTDYFRLVKGALAQNPNLPEELAVLMVRDPETAVREKLAYFTDIPFVLELLAGDPAVSVRQFLARNPHLPYNQMRQLAEDEDPQVRKVLVAHPNITPDILAQMAWDPAETVRRDVAQHPRTPISALEKLANDENRVVWGALLSNSLLPDDLREYILQKMAQ